MKQRRKAICIFADIYTNIISSDSEPSERPWAVWARGRYSSLFVFNEGKETHVVVVVFLLLFFDTQSLS